MSERVRRLLREPMVHFAVASALLFAVHHLVSPGDTSGRRIVVDRGVVEDLAQQHEATWHRPPSGPELAGLVESYVRDEVLYREGLAMGLDRDDPIIKRRVRQKLEMLAEDDPSAKEPTDAELSAYLASNAARFTRPAVYSFAQVFLGDAATGAELKRSAASAQQALGEGRDPATVGVPTLLPARVDETSADLVARDFGKPFADALAGVKTGEWAGPVQSAYGFHLVRVSAAEPASVPALAEVRSEVVRDWERERRASTVAERYAQLRASYDVVIDLPAADAGSTGAAETDPAKTSPL